MCASPATSSSTSKSPWTLSGASFYLGNRGRAKEAGGAADLDRAQQGPRL